MITSLYDDGHYHIFIGHRNFMLSPEEVTELQSYDFTENRYFPKSRAELEEELTDVKWECQNLSDQIPELEDLVKEFKDILKRILQ